MNRRPLAKIPLLNGWLKVCNSMYDLYNTALADRWPHPRKQLKQAALTQVGMAKQELQSGLQWLQLANPDMVGQKAAELVAFQLAEKPNSALVFPTGKTPLPMYAHLRQTSGINWEKSRLFQLDEYIKPQIDGPLPYQSFAAFMHQELWNFVGGQKFYLEQYFDCPLAYEALVTKDDGPDLIILGIGHNGHIAFNEPGSMDDSATRIVDLAEQTMLSNFGGIRQAGYPTQAITLGLKAILNARHILMLATGGGKKEIIQRAFNMETPPDPDCPASWLKRHPHVTLLTDFEFSSQ